ncbi:MAG: TRAP transporter large permease subunit, partial [Thiotrichales bacterium]|nr:TRAP transporter large permease subunit [Thiotrichales bacterium]
MELVFLALLIVLMIGALMSGFPVGFALPGSAIAAIAIAALCGWLFAGDADAYFAHGGPVEWLSAGVTNFRSLYWDVERDTLIAIPLFVFMGIMLQRSRIAEDLLVAMAQLFGPIPGGLGISVVFVGALLAATTGIVGATVIAMGLISLPAMLRNNYSKPLATGTICAAGTLGQIIPPSVVLIILADQLASAADIASTARKAEYREATGEITMPAEFDVVSASAGDMFMGAFIPGLILVAIYMIYILGQALLRPSTAPPVPYEGTYDLRFAVRVLLALVPPLTLIFAVLGSILAGIATVNQAGAIGAIGALIMGGYRLTAGQRNAFAPAIVAVLSLLVLFATLTAYDINIKNITGPEDVRGIVLASIGTAGLLVAIAWSLWRTYRIDDTLRSVMIETTKTTSMVFIILLGAAMLTSAFRAFGGEELVREQLTSLPGGFWTQFAVVMLVIFLLGFFLDFIEIAVVVVPIVAPILLADPSANITAVWLGVMIGINIQTSFLTPPFGFALFYLRGVAPAIVKTLQIYRGAVVFIALQLLGLGIAGAFPSLVNYLPNRVYLGSETAPPPMNPKLQYCLEDYVFARYDENGDELRAQIDRAAALDVGYLPDPLREKYERSVELARDGLGLVHAVREA